MKEVKTLMHFSLLETLKSAPSYCLESIQYLNQRFILPKNASRLLIVLITSQFNDKILDDHFLVHKGFVIMMFYVLQEPKSGNRKFHY